MTPRRCRRSRRGNRGPRRVGNETVSIPVTPRALSSATVALRRSVDHARTPELALERVRRMEVGTEDSRRPDDRIESIGHSTRQFRTWRRVRAICSKNCLARAASLAAKDGVRSGTTAAAGRWSLQRSRRRSRCGVRAPRPAYPAHPRAGAVAARCDRWHTGNPGPRCGAGPSLAPDDGRSARQNAGSVLMTGVVQQDRRHPAPAGVSNWPSGMIRRAFASDHRGEDAGALGAGEPGLGSVRGSGTTARRKCCSFGLSEIGSAMRTGTARRKGSPWPAHLPDRRADEELERHHRAHRVARADRSRGCRFSRPNPTGAPGRIRSFQNRCSAPSSSSTGRT